MATTLSAVVSWKLAGIKKIGWGWTWVIWLYNILTYLLLDPIKFAVRYALSGRAWGLVYNKRVSLYQLMTTFGKAKQTILDLYPFSETGLGHVSRNFRVWILINLVLINVVFQTAMTTQKDFGKEAREAAWAAEQRTRHGLSSMDSKTIFEKHNFRDINIMAEEAKRRAEIARSDISFNL